MLENRWYHVKVLPQRFHFNGHTTGFCARTQKLEQLYQTPLLPLAVLKDSFKHCFGASKTSTMDVTN